MDIQVITTPLTHKTTTEVVTKVIGVAVVEEPTEATGVDTEELTVDKDYASYVRMTQNTSIGQLTAQLSLPQQQGESV